MLCEQLVYGDSSHAIGFCIPRHVVSSVFPQTVPSLKFAKAPTSAAFETHQCRVVCLVAVQLEVLDHRMKWRLQNQYMAAVLQLIALFGCAQLTELS